MNRAHSLIPTAASVPPPAVEAQRSRSGLVALLAVGSLALLGGLGFAAVKGGAALGLGAPASGALAITVAGPGGAKLNGLKVLVDGVVKCEAAPCTLTALSAGTHFVSAEAPGYASTAARAVSVERNGESALHIELAPSAAPAPAANAAPAAKAEAQATSLSELRPEESARTAPSTAKADRPAEKLAKADKKETKQDDAKKAVAEDAAGQGTLNINSIPMASVVLDGRPVGSTPLVGLKVSPGPHSVVFIHPEHGRKSSGTTVKAGATATVAVRF